MEVENISKSMVFNYDLISNLIYQTNPNENEGNKNISVDILRKHYYDDILAAAYSNGNIVLWDTIKSEIKGSFNLYPSNITEIQWFLDDYILASAENDFGLFDLEKQKEVKRFKGHSNTIWAVKPLLASNIIASAGSDKIIILWDVRDAKPFNAILAHSLTINSLDFSSNREYLMSAGGDGYCRLWSLYNSKAIQTLMVDNTVYLTSAKFSFNNKYALVSSLKSCLTLFDLETSEIVTNFTGHFNDQYYIENSYGFIEGKQKFIVSGSEDGKIYLWEANTGALLLIKDIPNSLNNVVRSYINEYSDTSNELFTNSMGSSEIQYYINKNIK